MINDTHRCEARTRKGGRCKNQSVFYYRHQDGYEYLVCNQRHNEDFRLDAQGTIPISTLFRES